MENELIKIETKDGRQVVSARELYIGIGFDLSDCNFSRWIKKQLEDVDAVENEDYIVNVLKDVNPNGGKPITDYIITVDIAKEICMVIGVAPRCKDEVKQKSKQIRKYFIECEKQLKEVIQKPQTQLPTDYLSALKALVASEEEKQRLTKKIEEDKPKVKYTDNVLQAEGLITTTAIAKDFGMSARKLNGILNKEGIQYKQGGQWWHRCILSIRPPKCFL